MCDQFRRLRRSAVNRCGGEVSSLEAMQLCLRRNQGQACAEEYPDDQVMRNMCIGCINQASADRRLNPSSACWRGRQGPQAYNWFFLFAILIVLGFLIYSAVARSGGESAGASDAK